MAQPDISQILAALAQTQPTGTPQAPTPQQHAPPPTQPPPGYPPGMMNAPPPQAAYLPQPSSTGNIDLSGIKPVNSGSVSIADAIAKARNIAENRGLASYDSRQASAPRDDPRLANRGGQRSRSRSPPRRDAYNANPYRDERREDPRRGSYRRSPSPDRGFRGARDPPAGRGGNDGETETIRVKSALVGLIIGRNGENLRKVETDTGARVQFIQANDKHTPERQCTISGPLRARESAKAAIFSIIEENGGTPAQPEKGAYTAGMPGRAKVNLPALRDGEASTQIMVPDKTVGLIIGRGGETIKDLQERSGCHVNIVGENKSVSGLRPVNLIGSERATAVAKEMILEIVESDNRGENNRGAPGAMPPAGRDQGYQNNGRGGGGGGGGRDHIEKTISVPSEAVGMIIGKGGETIKDMQRSTGCKINVNQPKPPDVTRDIDLAGSASALDEAERVIWEKVETVRERDAASGRGGGGGGGGGGQSGGYGGRDQGASQYGSYSQPQQAPAVSGYGQYGAQAAQPQMAAWPTSQMPLAGQQQTPQPGAQSEQDVYAAQQWYAQWVAMAQQQQQQPPGGGQ